MAKPAGVSSEEWTEMHRRADLNQWKGEKVDAFFQRLHSVALYGALHRSFVSTTGMQLYAVWAFSVYHERLSPQQRIKLAALEKQLTAEPFMSPGALSHAHAAIQKFAPVTARSAIVWKDDV